MIRLILIRHGETAWNAQGRIQGHSDPELNETGILQARRVAERLKNEEIDAVYSSDLRRASRTAEIIAAPHGLEVMTTPLIREVNLGEWQKGGLTIEEIAERYPREFAAYTQDPVANRPPGAERLQDLIARCGEFLEEVRSAECGVRNREGEAPSEPASAAGSPSPARTEPRPPARTPHSIVVAAHGGSIRGMIAAALGLGPEIFRRIRLDNGGLSILEFNERGPQIVSLNDTCHLGSDA